MLVSSDLILPYSRCLDKLVIYGSNLQLFKNMQCVDVAESKQGFTDTTPMDLPLKADFYVFRYKINE